MTMRKRSDITCIEFLNFKLVMFVDEKKYKTYGTEKEIGQREIMESNLL